ncbi:class I SAM-dependent methyltransferase [Halorussus sp. MSC15.2]|uniref:class I SAM-dependent methyltransferase n=1 Tax=Halorussus sp. MSC15.2 TaxID=2283638 RepID=UPI0013CF88CA|nr:class I SAM-dependent methyltransferase [Halorussus sp. MSC15.2]NEU56701.1 class I SAM-dependent methyltransferase [Halorussus sp. MSC15.2]
MDEADRDLRDDGRAAVRATYDYIADHFAETREYAWPEVEEFVSESPDASVALDLGCGNGRHAELLAERADRVVAADLSRGLLETARERAADRGFDADLVQADAARLPLRDATVGVAVYVATLHHLPSRTARVGSLDELARVLSPGGRALVSAWSTEHDRFDREESEARASDSRAGDGRETGFDTAVDWTLPGGETVERFYHIYSPAEFEADVAASGLELAEFEVSSGNCYGVVRAAKQ